MKTTRLLLSDNSNRNRSALISLALIAISTEASAHGEEVMVTFGLQILSFCSCFLAIALSSHLQSQRRAAKVGVVVGLLIFFWPLGSIPYSANETLHNFSAAFVCPIFMLSFYCIAKFMKK
jgi:lipopolysaccharide export LptBFGC system permease protein LptF